MHIVWNLLERAGDWGWVVISLGITALALSVIAAFMGWVWRAPPRKVLSVCAAASGLILLVVLMGVVGMIHGYTRIAEMIAYTSAEDAARVQRIGPVLAKAPFWLSLVTAGCSAPFLAAAWYRGVIDLRQSRVHHRHALPSSSR